MDKKQLEVALSLHRRWDDLSRCISRLNNYREPSANNPLGEGDIPVEVLKFIDREAAAKGLLNLAIESAAELRKKLISMGVDLG